MSPYGPPEMTSKGGRRGTGRVPARAVSHMRGGDRDITIPEDGGRWSTDVVGARRLRGTAARSNREHRATSGGSRIHDAAGRYTRAARPARSNAGAQAGDAERGGPRGLRLCGSWELQVRLPGRARGVFDVHGAREAGGDRPAVAAGRAARATDQLDDLAVPGRRTNHAFQRSASTRTSRSRARCAWMSPLAPHLRRDQVAQDRRLAEDRGGTQPLRQQTAVAA